MMSFQANYFPSRFFQAGFFPERYWPYAFYITSVLVAYRQFMLDNARREFRVYQAVTNAAAVAVGMDSLLASGSVTLANTKLSAVDGTAFVDFGGTGGFNLYDHLGKYIEITDSAGKKIKGWIKSRGTGETLGGEIGAQ